MAAAHSGVNCKEVSEKTAAPSLISQHSPLRNVTNVIKLVHKPDSSQRYKTGIWLNCFMCGCRATFICNAGAILVNAEYYLEHALLRIHLVTTSIILNTMLFTYCHKLTGQPICFTLFTVGIGGIRYGYSGMTNDLTTPCSDSLERRRYN